MGACRGTFGLLEGLQEGAVGGAEAAQAAGYGDGSRHTVTPDGACQRNTTADPVSVPHSKSTSRAPVSLLIFSWMSVLRVLRWRW